MKKTLLALAAIAASSASFAQSSVTLYGVVDASLESVKTGNTSGSGQTVTRVSSDNLSTSRFGLKGVEDLGDGLKAKFNLESQIAVDTGASSNNSNRFFNRAAWVGLAGGFGEIRLGRDYSPIGDIAGNVLVSQNYDDLKIANTRAGNTYKWVDNTVSYLLPAVVPGLSAELQYSTAATGTAGTSASPTYLAAGGSETVGPGTEVAGSKVGRAYGLNAKYAAGPLSAGLGYLYSLDENAALPGNQKANATLIYGAYDFGVAKLTAYYDNETALPKYNNGSGAPRLALYGVKVGVPVAPNFTVIGSLSRGRNLVGLAGLSDNATFLNIRAIYDLSKRTSVYALLSNVKNGSASAAPATVNGTSGLYPTGSTATAGGDNHAVAVGVRHTF